MLRKCRDIDLGDIDLGNIDLGNIDLGDIEPCHLKVYDGLIYLVGGGRTDCIF